MRTNEYEILNCATLRRTVKDFPTAEDAYEHVRNLNRRYGKYELYNQMGHRVIVPNVK